MWDYLYTHDYLRMIIMALVLFPMVVTGALLRKYNKKAPYYNKLGIIAHFRSAVMAVLLVLGDYYIGSFPFSLTTYLIGVGASLVIVLVFAIIWLVFHIRYKTSVLIY